MTSATVPTRRQRQRLATMAEIVAVSRELLPEPGGLSLRAVAQRMGITAPALYRYVDDYADLVRLITEDIDAETADLLRAARDTQPADDPAAQIICAAVAFRRWALGNRAEFGLVFANPLNAHDHLEPHEVEEQQTGLVFTDLLVRVWDKYRFPLPAEADLDPEVLAALDDPLLPAKVDQIPPEARTLVWVFMQSWVMLYGTVTLEVFGHCDPRVIASGALFRSMMVNQAALLGLAPEFERLQSLIEEQMSQ